MEEKLSNLKKIKSTLSDYYQMVKYYPFKLLIES